MRRRWQWLKAEIVWFSYWCDLRGYCWACDDSVWFANRHWRRCQHVRANNDFRRIIQAGMEDGSIRIIEKE